MGKLAGLLLVLGGASLPPLAYLLARALGLTPYEALSVAGDEDGATDEGTPRSHGTPEVGTPRSATMSKATCGCGRAVGVTDAAVGAAHGRCVDGVARPAADAGSAPPRLPADATERRCTCKSGGKVAARDAAVAAADAAARQVGRRRYVRLWLVRHAQSVSNRAARSIVAGRDVESPLSARGIEQAEALAQRLERLQPGFDAVWTSCAARAKDTAALACRAPGVAGVGVIPAVHDDLLEVCYGAWEGAARKDVPPPTAWTPDAGDVDALCAFTPPGTSPVDGAAGESIHDVESRMLRFVEQHVINVAEGGSGAADAAASPGLERADSMHSYMGSPSASPRGVSGRPRPLNIAVFSHGFAIRCLVRCLTRAHPELVTKAALSNTGICELVYNPAGDARGGWKLLRWNDSAHLEGL